MKAAIMNRIRPFFMIILIILSSSFFLSFINRYDNKYQNVQAPVKNGQLLSSQLRLENNALYSLVDNWLFYPHIYRNATTNQDAKGVYTYLGQYPDFSMRDAARSPYGVSSYQLSIPATESGQTLAIYFPEIDIASEIWLDDTLVASNGNVKTTPIKARIQNTVITFSTEQAHTLYVIAANDTHYYSGMYYPCIVSTPQGIQSMILRKVLFYGFLVFSSLSIGLYSLNLWIRNYRDSVSRCFAAATLAFSLYASRELLRMWGISHVTVFYVFMDAAYFLMMYKILEINTLLSPISKKQHLLTRGMRLLSIGMCILPFANLFMLGKHADALLAYGWIVDGFKYISVLYILYTTLYGSRYRRMELWLLGANTFYIFGILYTLLGANLFEPLCFGWPNDYFSFFIVLSLAALMIQRSEQMAKENERLSIHLQETVEQRTEQLHTLLSERKAMLAEFAHDLKAPLSSMQSLIELIRMQDTLIDDEVEDYLKILERKSTELQNRMTVLQKFSSMDKESQDKHVFDLTQLLKQFHKFNKADCDAAGIYFLYLFDKEPCPVFADEKQLTRSLENLLYNALSFTEMNGTITLSLSTEGSNAHIIMEDTGCGIAPERQEQIFHKGVSLRDDSTERGLGLYITKSILAEHNGSIWVESDGAHGSAFHILLPLAYSNLQESVKP
ncbi:HAMP domain-containing histidine kinase [[Clostridium] innocuum]|nr:HAMP domain-containing histidine kinase [[Clostridium] innocuum]MCR0412952.1 HAMP domain-containing histidine kinase [[Clostridium] innocuum]MCR0535493.1 HAMP domain-containing histidine kinase [[Clostridium] innocuum]MCR0539221.1 HAMP domain-containing histidine kinase [[Clostridium] innocuum]